MIGEPYVHHSTTVEQHTEHRQVRQHRRRVAGPHSPTFGDDVARRQRLHWLGFVAKSTGLHCESQPLAYRHVAPSEHLRGPGAPKKKATCGCGVADSGYLATSQGKFLATQ